MIIYLVVGGAYSDWWIDSYFENEEEAEKYCFIKNKGKDDYDSLYVKEIEKNGSIIDYSKIELKNHFEIAFVLKNEKWCIHSITKEYYQGEKKPTISKNKCPNRFNWGVEVTADTEEKAKKIAFDLVGTLKEVSND